MKASTIIGGASSAHAREDRDFYPTPPDVTRALLDYLAPRANRFAGRAGWDPAAGDGAMLDVMRDYFPLGVVGTDIAPQRKDIKTMSFFNHANYFLGYPQWIISNPPFNLAVDFIKCAHELRCRGGIRGFAFLLKSTFWHAKGRADLFDLTGPADVLPLLWRPNMKPARGNAPTMDFAWTVWGDSPRDETCYRPLRRPE